MNWMVFPTWYKMDSIKSLREETLEARRQSQEMQTKLQRSVDSLKDEVSKLASSQDDLKQSIDVLQAAIEA